MLKEWLIQKLGGRLRGRDILPEERAKGHINRQMNKLHQQSLDSLQRRQEMLDLRIAEKRIAEQEDELRSFKDDDGDDDSDDLIETIKTAVQMFSDIKSDGNIAPQPLTPPSQSIPDNQLITIKNQIPKKELKRLKKLDDVALKGVVLQYLGPVDEVTSQKAIALVRE